MVWLIFSCPRKAITFFTPDPTNPVVGGNYNVAGTSNSTLAVSFSTPSPTICALSGNRVDFFLVGSCVVHFLQPGNGTYNAAVPVVRTFTIGKGNQVISFTR
jgi:hypothetical protein